MRIEYIGETLEDYLKKYFEKNKINFGEILKTNNYQFFTGYDNITDRFEDDGKKVFAEFGESGPNLAEAYHKVLTGDESFRFAETPGYNPGEKKYTVLRDFLNSPVHSKQLNSNLMMNLYKLYLIEEGQNITFFKLAHGEKEYFVLAGVGTLQNKTFMEKLVEFDLVETKMDLDAKACYKTNRDMMKNWRLMYREHR